MRPGAQGREARLWLFLLAAGVVIPAAGAGASPRKADLPAQLARAEAKLTWRIVLPVQMSAPIKTYCLVDEYLYALAADGRVHCIAAADGDHRWFRQMAEPNVALWPPAPLRGVTGQAVVFIRFDEAVFVDPQTGRQISTRKLEAPSVNSAAAFGNSLFTVEIANRLRNYDIKGKFRHWQIRGHAPFQLAPLHAVNEDVVFFADDSGRIAAAGGADKVKHFERRVEGEPRGWLALDDEGLYVATSANLLYKLSRKTGNVLWQQYLPASPAGGPVLTKTSIYQALQPAGVLRLDKNLQGPAWRADQAVRFLAEWPKHTVMLAPPGTIIFLNPQDGLVEQAVALDEEFTGISNVWNDAVFAGTATGTVLCLRPLAAKTLAPADFKPVLLVPATRPSASQPAELQASPDNEGQPKEEEKEK